MKRLLTFTDEERQELRDAFAQLWCVFSAVAPFKWVYWALDRLNELCIKAFKE